MTDQVESPRARAMAALRLLSLDKAERAQAALSAIRGILDGHKCVLSVEWVRGDDGRMAQVPVVVALDYGEADLAAYEQAEARRIDQAAGAEKRAAEIAELAKVMEAAGKARAAQEGGE